MRKAKLLAGQYGVYAVFDKVSKHYKHIYFASNDEDFIRLNLPQIILDTPLRDLKIFRIGIFNDVTGELKQTVKRVVNTDCYLFPHSRLSPQGENVSPEEIEKAVNDTKNEILAKTSTVVEEENNEGVVNE